MSEKEGKQVDAKDSLPVEDEKKQEDLKQEGEKLEQPKQEDNHEEPEQEGEAKGETVPQVSTENKQSGSPEPEKPADASDKGDEVVENNQQEEEQPADDATSPENASNLVDYENDENEEPDGETGTTDNGNANEEEEEEEEEEEDDNEDKDENDSDGSDSDNDDDAMTEEENEDDGEKLKKKQKEDASEANKAEEPEPLPKPTIIEVPYTVADAEKWMTETVSKLGKLRGNELENFIAELPGRIREFALAPLLQNLLIMEGVCSSRVLLQTPKACESATIKLKQARAFTFKVSEPLRFFLTKALINVVDKVMTIQCTYFSIPSVQEVLQYSSYICAVLAFYCDPENPRMILNQQRAEMTEEQRKALKPAVVKEEDKKALAGDVCYQSYALLERIFDSNKRFYKLHDPKHTFQVKAINDYYYAQGFERLAARINSTDAVLGPEDILVMLRPLEIARVRLIPSFIAGFVDKLIDRTLTRICGFTVRNFQGLERDLVASMLRAVKAVLQGASSGGEEKALAIALHLIDLLLHMPQLDMRILGLRELNEIIKAFEPAPGSLVQKPVIKIPDMIRWIDEHEIVKALFDVNTTHHEIEKRSEPILSFLLRNNTFTESQLDYIWICAVKPGVGDAVQGATFDLVVSLSKSFSLPLWNHLNSLLASMDLATMTASASGSKIFHSFLCKFLDAAVESKRFVAADAEPEAWVPPSSLDFVWNTLMTECKEDTVQEEVNDLLVNFCKALLSPISLNSASVYSLPMFMHYVNSAISSLVDGSSVRASLVFLARLFQDCKRKMRVLKRTKTFIAETMTFVTDKDIIKTVLGTIEKAATVPGEEGIVRKCFAVLRSVLVIILPSFQSFNELVKMLWSLLAKNKALRNDLFQFLRPLLTDENNKAGETSMRYVTETALKELDGSEYGENEWDFFVRLFCDINIEAELIEYDEKRDMYLPTTSDHINYIAMDTYWYIALGTTNEGVAAEARSNLMQLLTAGDNNKPDANRFSGAVEQTLTKCLEVVDGCTNCPECEMTKEKLLACQRALLFITSILEMENKKAPIQRSHLSMSKSTPFTFSLRSLVNGQRTIEARGSDTVEYIRDIAHREFFFKDKNLITLISNKQRLQNLALTLSDCGINGGCVITAMEQTAQAAAAAANKASQKPFSLQTQVLTGVLSQPPAYDLLLRLLKNPPCGDKQVLNSVFEVLCTIPTEPNLLAKLVSGGKEAVNLLNEFSDAPAQLLLYILMSVDALVVLTSDDSRKWKDEFIAADGVAALFKLINKTAAGNPFADKALLLALSSVEKLLVANQGVSSFLNAHNGEVQQVLMQTVLAISSGEENLASQGICLSAFTLLRTVLAGAESPFNEKFLEWLFTVLAGGANVRAREACLNFTLENALPANGSLLFAPVLNYLLSKLDTLPSMSHCTEYSRCICSLLGAFSKKDTAPDAEPVGCAEIVSKLVEMVKQRPIMEKRDLSVIDEQLCAMMNILRALFYKTEYAKAATRAGLVEELFTNCLMAIPTKDNHGDLSPPKCKTILSRSDAFDLLKKTVELDAVAAEQVCKLAKSTVDGYSERLMGWRYEPLYRRRADCGFSGLINLGCTCYMNSVMQQLFMTSAFRNCVLQLPPLPPKEEKSEGDKPKEETVADDDESKASFGTVEAEKLVPRLQALYSRMIASEQLAQDTKAFVCTLTHDGQAVNPYEQMDAEEFLTSLLDRVEEYAKACGKDERIRDIFYGNFARQMIPDGCEHKRENQEQFISLQLDVNGKKGVEDSLATFFESEVFSDYLCEECNQRYDTTRRCRLARLPKTLFVQCKRFEFNYDTMRRYKITDEFLFPTKLDLSKYMREGTPAPDYTLVGVVVHSGTADSGHYYSYIRDRSSPEERWLWFNDSSVQPFNPASIPEECYGGMTQVSQYDAVKRQSYKADVPKAHSGYLLVYEQLDKAETTSLAESEAFIPEKIRDAVWKDNEQFLTDVSVINPMFFECLTASVEKLVDDCDAVACEDETKMVDDGEAKEASNVEQPQDMAKLLTQLVFNVMVHSTDTEGVKRAFKVLVKAYSKIPSLTLWFLDECTKKEWLETLMSKCPVPKNRKEALTLLPVVFKLACEKERDNLNEYRVEKEAESDESEKGEKKKKQPCDDPLLKDWPAGEAVSPVTRFIDSYIKKLRSLNTCWRNFSDYFAVIEAFAAVGPKEREHLLAKHIVAMLVDLYLFELSPLAKDCKQKREPMGDKKAVPDFTRLFDALHACMVDLMPLSSFFEDTAARCGVSSPLLPDVDRSLLFNSSFLSTVLDDAEASPGLSKLMCSCCVESEERTKRVMQTALSHLSLPDYRSLVFQLLDLTDSVHDKRAVLVVDELVSVVADVSSAASSYDWKNYNSNNCITDGEKGEAVLFVSELVSNEKNGLPMLERLFALRDKWLPFALVSCLDPPVRKCAVGLLSRCMQSTSSTVETPAIDEERCCKCLESLMQLIPTAARSILPPARVAGKVYHQDYDWRLMEYGIAVKACLVGEAQRQVFGNHVVLFSELLQSVDVTRRAGDKSKWALFDALLEGLRGTPENLQSLLTSRIFIQGICDWSISLEKDSDQDLSMFFQLLSDLTRIKIEFLGFLVQKRLFFWILNEMMPRTDSFPKSTSLFMPLVTLAMNTPEIAKTLMETLYLSTLQCFEWPEMMKYLRIVMLLKKDYSDILTRAFWSDRMIQETVKSFQEVPECFPALCKFTALFIKDIPEGYKSHLLTYILSSYNCYTYILSEKPDNPPRPEDLKSMEEDVDAILRVFCETWQHGATRLFDALVNDPVCHEDGAIEMVVKSVQVHRVVTRVFEEGMAALPTYPADYASNARRTLLGMAIAYVAMCSPEMEGLSEFVKNLRGHIALGSSDPLVSFEANKIARAIMYLTAQPLTYSAETESLLAECFSKSAPFEVNDSFVSLVDNALQVVSGPACLQKLFIICNSPFMVRSIGSLLVAFIDDVQDTDEVSVHYVGAIRQLLTQPARVEPKQQVPVQSAPETMSVPSENPANASATQPAATVSQPAPEKQQQKGEDDDDDEAQHQPLGLPPSDAGSTDMA